MGERSSLAAISHIRRKMDGRTLDAGDVSRFALHNLCHLACDFNGRWPIDFCFCWLYGSMDLLLVALRIFSWWTLWTMCIGDAIGILLVPPLELSSGLLSLEPSKAILQRTIQLELS